MRTIATRRERVVLDLESNLPEGMLRGAGATQVLRMELERLSAASVRSSRVSQDASKGLDRVDASARKADQSINQLTGRIRLFADLVAIFGPGIIPMLGAAGAGVMALAAQMGSAAIAGGVLLGSLQGVGDGLKAIHEANLEPTAENLAELDKVMSRLSPAAREFAREAYTLLPMLRALRDAGAANLFPGLVDSIGNIELLESELTRIMQTMGRVTGNMASDVTDSLASDRWAEFFDFVADEGPQAVRQLTKTVGSLTHGLAELWMAFDPVNDDAGRFMKNLARDFDEWATKLDQTQGFEDFMEYLHTTGPLVADMLGSLFNALVQIAQAAAPLGGPVLQGMTALLDVLAEIAGSDVGPTLMAAVTAMALLSRGTALFDKAAGSAFSKTHVANIRGMATALDMSGRSALTVTERVTKMKAGFGTIAKGSAVMGGLALASSGAADSIGLTNTLSLGLMGTMAGPWGAAVGAGVGLMMDFASSQRDAQMDVSGLRATLDQQTGAITENTRQWAANELEKAGALSTAQQLGISLSTVTDAALGNADAMAQVEAATRAAYENGLQQFDTGAGSANTRVSELGMAALGLRDAVGLTNDELTASQAAIDRTAAAVDEGSGAYTLAEARVESFTRAVARLNRLLADRAGMRDYQQSLDDFTQSMKENGRNWDINTQKGRDNQAALDDIVGTTLKVAEGLRGAARTRFLTSAIADLREASDKWDTPKDQVRDLIRLLREANGVRVRPIIDADVVQAMSAIDRVRNALAGIKDKSVTVRVTQSGAAVTPGFGPVGSADGSFVPKTGLPYADRHLYLLADGEGITTNRRGETDRFKDVISGINAGYSRATIKGMLAGGGIVGDRKDGKPKASGSEWVPDRTEALQAAIDRLTAVAQEQTAAVEDQTRRTDEWSQRMSDVAQATVAGFNTGLFERDSNPWAAGAGGGPFANLSRDIAGLQQRGALQAQLAAAGLDGDALAAALSQGSNADLSALLASGQVQGFEDLYNQRAALQAQVSGAAGQQAFGAQYGEALQEQKAATAAARATELQLVALNGRLERMEKALQNAPERIGSATGSAVRGEAAKGHRDRKNRSGGGPA